MEGHVRIFFFFKSAASVIYVSLPHCPFAEQPGLLQRVAKPSFAEVEMFMASPVCECFWFYIPVTCCRPYLAKVCLRIAVLLPDLLELISF